MPPVQMIGRGITNMISVVAQRKLSFQNLNMYDFAMWTSHRANVAVDIREPAPKLAYAVILLLMDRPR